jgi:hypothetical protein
LCKIASNAIFKNNNDDGKQETKKVGKQKTQTTKEN